MNSFNSIYVPKRQILPLDRQYVVIPKSTSSSTFPSSQPALSSTTDPAPPSYTSKCDHQTPSVPCQSKYDSPSRYSVSLAVSKPGKHHTHPNSIDASKDDSNKRADHEVTSVGPETCVRLHRRIRRIALRVVPAVVIPCWQECRIVRSVLGRGVPPCLHWQGVAVQA